MTDGVIEINGLRLYAYHGCLEEEAAIGANYIIDLKIHTDYSAAAISDDLSRTVDYCIVYDLVKAEMAIRSRLIENVACRIAYRIKNGIRNISRVEVKVKKLNPPVNGEIENVSVIYVL